MGAEVSGGRARGQKPQSERRQVFERQLGAQKSASVPNDEACLLCYCALKPRLAELLLLPLKPTWLPSMPRYAPATTLAPPRRGRL